MPKTNESHSRKCRPAGDWRQKKKQMFKKEGKEDKKRKEDTEKEERVER